MAPYFLVQGEVHTRSTGKIAMLGRAVEGDVDILYLRLGVETTAEELGKLLGIVRGTSILEVEQNTFLIFIPAVPQIVDEEAFLRLYINCLEQKFQPQNVAEIHFARFISKTPVEGMGVVFCIGSSEYVEGMRKSGAYSLYFFGILNRNYVPDMACKAAEAAMQELMDRVPFVPYAEVLYQIVDNRFIAVLEVNGITSQRTIIYLTRAIANNLAEFLDPDSLVTGQETDSSVAA